MAREPSEDVQAVLEFMDSMDAPPLHELDPEAAREMAAQRNQVDEPIEAVGSVEDRTIPGSEGEIPVRIYVPEGDGPHPVVVHFHGGGFVVGGLDSHDDACRVLTNAAEAVVVAVDYRLAPEHPFPAAVEDAYAATEWVADHAAELDADPDRLAVLGDSAGGTLAAVVSLAVRDRGGPAIAQQTLIYPALDFRSGAWYPSYRENDDGYLITTEAMDYFEDHLIPSWVHEGNPYLVPFEAESHADLPPATVATMGFDPLRDEGRAYAEILKSAGVPVKHREYDDLIHGVSNMLREPMDVAGGHEVLADVAADLRAALH